MPSVLLTPPAVEPLTLAEAKSYLRVDTADEDDTIAALIAAARLLVEAHARRALITQSWRLSLDCWPANGRIAVAPAPLQSLSAARVFGLDNVAHALDVQSFVPDRAGSALDFVPWAVMQPGRPAAGIELDVVCGDGDGPADVPESLRQAIRLIVAQWYDSRGAAPDGTAPLPAGVHALIAPYRMVSL